VASDPHAPDPVLVSQADAGVTLLDPCDVQRSLKLSSRRVARDLIVREMEHVVVGRTPKTTTRWLADWLERQRRSPRRPTLQSRRPSAPSDSPNARRPSAPSGAPNARRSTSPHLPTMPRARRGET
jgi:hypothetical protein